jgi:hypothetical protein
LFAEDAAWRISTVPVDQTSGRHAVRHLHYRWNSDTDGRRDLTGCGDRCPTRSRAAGSGSSRLRCPRTSSLGAALRYGARVVEYSGSELRRHLTMHRKRLSTFTGWLSVPERGT